MISVVVWADKSHLLLCDAVFIIVQCIIYLMIFIYDIMPDVFLYLSLIFFIWTIHSLNWDGWRCYSTIIEEETPISFSGKHLIFSW